MTHSKSHHFQSIYDNSEEEKRLMEPLFYMREKPERGNSQRLIQVLNSFFQIPNEEFPEFKKYIFPLLLASLLVDDIADASDLRRGVPCSYLKYGIRLTRRTSTYTVLLVYKILLRIKKRKLMDVVLRKILSSGKGQGLEIYWRDNLICPTEKEYKEMTARKTGALFACVMHMLNYLSDYKYDCDWSRFAALFGTFFQIRDDHRNLTSPEYTEAKGFCEDFSEGKFSFPVIHAIRTRPEDKRIINILKQRPKDEETKKIGLSLLKEFGSLDYTYQVLVALKDELKEEVKIFPNNLEIISYIDESFASEESFLSDK